MIPGAIWWRVELSLVSGDLVRTEIVEPVGQVLVPAVGANCAYERSRNVPSLVNDRPCQVANANWRFVVIYEFGHASDRVIGEVPRCRLYDFVNATPICLHSGELDWVVHWANGRHRQTAGQLGCVAAVPRAGQVTLGLTGNCQGAPGDLARSSSPTGSPRLASSTSTPIRRPSASKSRMIVPRASEHSTGHWWAAPSGSISRR